MEIQPQYFGIGRYGHACRLCGENDATGTINHLPGCKAEGQQAEHSYADWFAEELVRKGLATQRG